MKKLSMFATKSFHFIKVKLYEFKNPRKKNKKKFINDG